VKSEGEKGAETEKKRVRENRALVHTFLNVGSTSVFTKKKPMLPSDVNIKIGFCFGKKPMLTNHFLTSVFWKTDVNVSELTLVFLEPMLT